jgi:excisionase family DNA binding protein
MDAPQHVSLGSDSKALSSDLTLSSCQVTTENGIHALDLATLPPVQRTHVDQGSLGFTQHVVDASAASSTSPALEPSTDLIVGMIWKTFRDLAAHRPEAIPAILEGSRSFSADFGAGGSLAAPVAAANAPEPPVGPLQVPNNSQGSPKTRETNFMSTSEAAQFLDITEGMVRRHCESGTIEGKKLGRDWIVIRESVERFQKNPPKRGRKPKASGE